MENSTTSFPAIYPRPVLSASEAARLKCCRWCHAAVPKGRRTWCGDECVEAYKNEHDWQHIRRNVLARDRGVCALCGIECLQVYRLLYVLYWGDTRYGLEPDRPACGTVARSWGVSWGWPRDMWEADHITPRVLGGCNRMENLRTLCLPCHKAETRALRRRLALAKKALDTVPDRR